MAQDLQLALQMQRMDQQLALLQAEIRGLPKRIEMLEAKLESHQRRLEADQAALAANQTETRRLAAANVDAKAKIEKLKKQTMQSTTQEQLSAFQHEIKFAEDEIIKNDASSFRLLEESEALAVTVREAETALAAERLNVEKEKVAATALSEVDRKKGVKIYREREALAKLAPAPLLKDYERLRRKHKDGVVVADGTDGRCGSCQMNIRPALLQQIRQYPEQIFHCENCLRMLSYNPPQSIEGTASSAQLSS